MFLLDLGRKIEFVSGNSQKPSFLFFSTITIQRFNSILLHNSFLSDEDDWPFHDHSVLTFDFNHRALGIFTAESTKQRQNNTNIFQSQAGHLRTCTMQSYLVTLVYDVFAPVTLTLTLTRWPWYTTWHSCSKDVPAYQKWTFYLKKPRLLKVRVQAGRRDRHAVRHTHGQTDRQTDRCDRRINTAAFAGRNNNDVHINFVERHMRRLQRHWRRCQSGAQPSQKCVLHQLSNRHVFRCL